MAHRAPLAARAVPAAPPPRRRAVAVLAVLALALGGVAVMTSSAAAVPRSIWSAQDAPRAGADPEVARVELGTRFTTSVPGQVRAIRYYSFPVSIGPSTGSLWDAKGRKLASVAFTQKGGSGWQRAALDRPVSLKANVPYVVSYTSGGRYAGDAQYFGRGKVRTSGPLTASAGLYRYGSGFPTQSWRSSSYYADVEFFAGDVAADSTPTPTPSSTPSVPPTTPGPSPTRTPTPTATPSSTRSATPTPTPSSTPSTTPTAPAPPPPATGGSNCAPQPSRCGFPDASNTGPSGTLKRVPQDVTSGKGWHWDTRGWVEIDGAGAVFSGYSLTAPINVTASNVVISNVSMVEGGEDIGIGLRHTSNVVISNVQITAPDASANRLMVAIKDIYGDSTGLVVRASDISRTSTGIQVESGLLEGNYIHDLGLKGGDHVNGITSNGGSGQLTIRRNTVFNQHSQTDAIGLFQDFGPQRNRLVTGNLLAGGGYTVYAGANPGMAATTGNVVVTNNRFARMYYASSGYYGPYTAFASGNGNLWSGNVWDDTGAALGR